MYINGGDWIVLPVRVTPSYTILYVLHAYLTHGFNSQAEYMEFITVVNTIQPVFTNLYYFQY